MPIDQEGNGLNRGFITFAVMLATVMQVLDTTIVNVALPHMQGAFSATQDQVAWILTSYLVAAAVMTPPTGWLAARLGRKRLFLISVTMFTIMSMLCGMAGTLEEIVIFRLLQGVAGAALVPLSQAVLLDSYPRERHGTAMALWGIGIMVGPILGPTLGGYLTEFYSWRWVFYINLPVGILAFFSILAVVPETPQRRDRPFDISGFVFLSLGIIFLQLMLDRGQHNDWFSSPEIVIETCIMGLAFYLYLVHSATTRHPFLDPGLLQDRNFTMGLVLIFVVGIILLATIAILPPYLQSLMDYPVFTIGLILAPRGVGTMISMFMVGRLVNRVDTRLLIFTGFILTTVSLWMMAQFNLQISESAIIWSGVVQGLGLGLIFVPLSTIAFSTLAPTLRTEAAGIFSLVRNIGSSIGISVIFTLFSHNLQVNHARLAQHVSPYNPLYQAPFLPDAWNIHTPPGLMALNAEVTRQAAQIAYLDDFRLMMFITLFTLPLVFLLRRSDSHPTGVATAATTD
ncbi:MAG TPA: DHA2 family efflux MFS transporter permease subunit [Gammaproteobacteria bacterium]|nr:DHA2 family efflux MFS transporter permease subunit [Gammaproteobacteria bacterium]